MIVWFFLGVHRYGYGSVATVYSDIRLLVVKRGRMGTKIFLGDIFKIVDVLVCVRKQEGILCKIRCCGSDDSCFGCQAGWYSVSRGKM